MFVSQLRVLRTRAWHVPLARTQPRPLKLFVLSAQSARLQSVHNKNLIKICILESLAHVVAQSAFIRQRTEIHNIAVLHSFCFVCSVHCFSVSQRVVVLQRMGMWYWGKRSSGMYHVYSRQIYGM